MKKLNLFFYCSFFMFLFSCTSDEGIRYSCDEPTDMWVKENLVTIRSLSRREWMELDDEKQLASYRAFTPEQKIQFWKAKISEVKKLDWTDAEIAHIDEVGTFIDNHKNFFESKKLTDAESDELELFFYKWQKYGIEQLGWNDRLAQQLFATGSALKDTQDNIIIKKPYPYVDCNCNTEKDFCPEQIYPCRKVKWCQTTNNGCGWLLLAECNGRCMGL
ncbi:MAG: bacteriocin fulvocin C-related protein [Ruminobacter sp.]|nr:bacteriocin fulvocin C-related protein [Ruminobacter sp.]